MSGIKGRVCISKNFHERFKGDLVMNRGDLTCELKRIKSKLKESRRIELDKEYEGFLESLEELIDEGVLNKEQYDIISEKIKDSLMYGIHTVVGNYNDLI